MIEARANFAGVHCKPWTRAGYARFPLLDKRVSSTTAVCVSGPVRYI